MKSGSPSRMTAANKTQTKIPGLVLSRLPMSSLLLLFLPKLLRGTRDRWVAQVSFIIIHSTGLAPFPLLSAPPHSSHTPCLVDGPNVFLSELVDSIHESDKKDLFTNQFLSSTPWLNLSCFEIFNIFHLSTVDCSTAVAKFIVKRVNNRHFQDRWDTVVRFYLTLWSFRSDNNPTSVAELISSLTTFLVETDKVVNFLTFSYEENICGDMF